MCFRMVSTSGFHVLMLVLTFCLWRGDGQSYAVSNTPTWPTTGCSFTRHQGMRPRAGLYTYSFTITPTNQDECESRCLSEATCGTYEWRALFQYCYLYQFTPTLMKDLTGIPLQAWRISDRAFNMGSKDCEVVEISETVCGSYIGHDRKNPSTNHIITGVYQFPPQTLTAAMCQSMCDMYDACVSVRFYTTSNGGSGCALLNTTILDLIASGREDEINTVDDAFYPIWITYECDDVDECRISNNCSVNAGCNNTLGGYTCTCYSGFSGDGFTCSDIDECSSCANNCFNADVCTNTPGSYTCQCPAGLSGDGVTCNAVPSTCPAPPDCPDNCFYIKSSVNTPKGSKFLGDLDPGDKVLTLSDEGGLRYEKVIMDIHRLPELETWFIKIQTQRNSIMVTPKHFLYAGKHPDSTKLVTADKITVGDYLLVNMKDSVGVEEVVKVEMVHDRGISTPVVASGRMLVNEILASVYVDDIHPLTPKSFHTMMWVMRMFNIYNIHVMDHEVEGMPAWAYYADSVREKFA